MTDRAALARPMAALTTATVDVQVLRIGAKQMTLAVFKQLLRDDDITGSMWGTVNYHHGSFNCDHRGEHRHVVWQKDDVLRHAVVWEPRRVDWNSPLTRIESAQPLDDITRQKIIDRLSWEELRGLARRLDSYSGRYYEGERTRIINEALQEATTLAGLYERLEDESIYEKMLALWLESGKLPQLFIAV